MPDEAALPAGAEQDDGQHNALAGEGGARDPDPEHRHRRGEAHAALKRSLEVHAMQARQDCCEMLCAFKPCHSAVGYLYRGGYCLAFACMQVIFKIYNDADLQPLLTAVNEETQKEKDSEA